MKQVLTALIALTLPLGACVADTTETSSALPLSATSLSGQQVLAGTYTPATGEVWLVDSTVTALEASVAATDFDLEIQGAPIDFETGGAFVALDLEPGAALPVVGRQDGMRDADVTELRVENREWVNEISEEDANTSFAACPDPSIPLILIL